MVIILIITDKNRTVGGLTGLSVPTPCQIECLFSADCHFVVLVVNSACTIGNFKLPSVEQGFNAPRIASIFKGKKRKEITVKLL